MAFWARYIGGFRHVRAREDRPDGRWGTAERPFQKHAPRGVCVTAAVTPEGCICACVQS
jgi:hypothetical protein